ncbi:hypothetical protein GT037_009475, partial [Alternaria burnsii]
LSSKYSIYSIYSIALVVETFIILYILAIYILYILTKLSLSIDFLTLLYFFFTKSLFYKVGKYYISKLLFYL